MRILSADDVRAVLTHALAHDATVHAFLEHLAGRTSTSQPPLMRLTVGANGRFQAKAAAIGDMVGLRFAGELDGRHVDEGRMLALYEAMTLLPRALVPEAELYRYRVAAQVAVTIDRLAPANAKVLTVIGAGRLGRAIVASVQALRPFTTVQLYARTFPEEAARTLARCTASSVEAVRDLPRAIAASDVVVTITTATTPVVAGADVAPGTLVVSAGGGWECDARLYRHADRLYVDDWDHCTQVGDLAVLTDRGVVTSQDVAGTLSEVIGKGGTPRCGPQERVAAVPQGMTITDVALASAVLAAVERGEDTP